MEQRVTEGARTTPFVDWVCSGAVPGSGAAHLQTVLDPGWCVKFARRGDVRYADGMAPAKNRGYALNRDSAVGGQPLRCRGCGGGQTPVQRDATRGASGLVAFRRM